VIEGTDGEAVERYLRYALAGEARTCVRLALDLLDRGAPFDEVIVGLLGAAQREVGERWLRNEWTAADEHLVSGITQKTLDAIANSVEPPVPEGLVVIACAEGEWHSLPAQMFAEMLRWHGFEIANLGASTPADHVAGLIARDHPDALAVSCTVPLFFPGVTRLVDAAHRQATPVIAGGRALGAGPGRATRLGADSWAAGIDDALSVLRRWRNDPPHLPTGPTVLDPVALQLDGTAPEIATVAFQVLKDAYPPMAAYDERQLARTEEDLAYTVRYVAAARLADDPTVLTEMLDWLRTLLAARGVPPDAVAIGLAVLAPLVSRLDPEGGRLALGAV
jgi:methanogenic corrinoid protein MtbC1